MPSLKPTRRELRHASARREPTTGRSVPVALCQVLRLGNAPTSPQADRQVELRAEGMPSVLPSGSLAEGPLGEFDGRLWLAVAFSVLRPGGVHRGRQMLVMESRVDQRGRTRPALLCPESSCQKPSRALYRLVTETTFRCGRCSGVDYHRRPPCRSLPRHLDGRLRHCLRTTEALVRAVSHDSTAHKEEAHVPAPSSSRRGISPARRQQLEYRRAALAQLWAYGLWRPEDLAALFGVSERSIRRDLRRARSESPVPDARGRQRRHVQLAEAEQLTRECDQLCQEVRAHTAGRKRAVRLWAVVALAELHRAQSQLLAIRAALSPPSAVASSPRKRPARDMRLDFLRWELLASLER
jgi:AraC-like DNA-binding protein